MDAVTLFSNATEGNFSESAYLAANPDVAAAVERGVFPTGRRHFDLHGKREKRKLRLNGIPEDWRREKADFLRASLKPDLDFSETAHVLDCLSAQDRMDVGSDAGGPISGWGYDSRVKAILGACPADGWVLDCGAGRRPVYYRRVVNLEIFPYETTDIVARNDALPFRDAVFDAVISASVLEHVPDPFQCAREIARVLKPGGVLFCSVPFLQPYHGYPHHYFNMTERGLRTLFEEHIHVEKQEVYESLHPVSALCWIVRSWADGLHGEAREAFENLRVSDLMRGRDAFLGANWVRELPPDKQMELAAATVLIGRKQ